MVVARYRGEREKKLHLPLGKKKMKGFLVYLSLTKSDWRGFRETIIDHSAEVIFFLYIMHEYMCGLILIPNRHYCFLTDVHNFYFRFS